MPFRGIGWVSHPYPIKKKLIELMKVEVLKMYFLFSSLF